MSRDGGLSFQTFCKYGVRILFLLCTAFVVYVNFCYQIKGDANVLLIVLVMAAALEILILTKGAVKHWKEFLDKNFKIAAAVYLLALLGIQILVGNIMRYLPMWDLGSVYHGAISWAEHGNVDSYAEYFYYFPHNLGLTVLFKYYFSLVHGIFGSGTDYYVAALVLGSVIVSIFRFSVIGICKKMFGTTYAIVAMVLMLLCIPLYFASAVFYTDVMSMAAPSLFYLCYLCSKEAQDKKKHIGWYALMALIAAVGMEIKFTVVIILIAVMMEMLLQKYWKQCLVMLGVHIVVISAAFSGVNHIVYSEVLDEKQAEAMNTPYLHWVMMGAQGNGSYNGADYELTRSYTDKKEQQKALLVEIRKRYKNMGFSGVLKLWKNKTLKCFGDGSFGLSDFLDDKPQKQNVLHDWVLYSGKNFGKYQAFCLGVFWLILLLMLVGVLGSFWRKAADAVDMTALWLTFFGIWLFLMFWETSSRYFTNHLSAMLVAAVYGLWQLDIVIKKIADKLEQKKEKAVSDKIQAVQDEK